jgi:hypothetical protein
MVLLGFNKMRFASQIKLLHHGEFRVAWVDEPYGISAASIWLVLPDLLVQYLDILCFSMFPSEKCLKLIKCWW